MPSPFFAWKFSIKELFWNTTVFSNELFWYSQTKSFRRKIVTPPIMNKNFRYPKVFEILMGCPPKFSALWDPKFRRKNVIPTVMHKMFRHHKTSETFKGCPRNFLALWDQKLSTEKRDTPFSSTKHLETRNFLKNSRIPLWNFSALWDMKISTENRDMPALIHNFFSIPEVFWKTESFLYNDFRFGPVRQKNSAKSWCPPPSYAWKFPIKEFFWNTTVFSNEIVWYSQTRTFRRKNVIPPTPIMNKIFQYPKLSETFKGCPQKLSALWDPKFPTEKRNTPCYA